MPIDVRLGKATKNVFSKDFEESIDQVWAEAVHMYKNREPLFLSPAADEIADTLRTEHCDIDDRRGVIEQYLETLLPENWGTLDMFARRLYLSDPKNGTRMRTSVCVAEIWCECLGKEKRRYEQVQHPGY